MHNASHFQRLLTLLSRRPESQTWNPSVLFAARRPEFIAMIIAGIMHHTSKYCNSNNLNCTRTEGRIRSVCGVYSGRDDTSETCRATTPGVHIIAVSETVWDALAQGPGYSSFDDIRREASFPNAVHCIIAFQAFCAARNLRVYRIENVWQTNTVVFDWRRRSVKAWP